MKSSIVVFMLAMGIAASVQAQDAASVDSKGGGQKQTANSGGQVVRDTPHAATKDANEHWTDGMSTRNSPQPRKIDEYGAPKVTPPKGQGTDNNGGLPRSADDGSRK